MKSLIIVFLSVCALVACKKKEELPAPQAPNAKGGGLATAPVDYLASAAKAQQTMEKNIDTSSLNSAIQLFNVQEGRLPADLNELVTKKYLPKIPTPPHGMKLQYDAQEGKVAIVKE
jgi:hypothetical protein